MFARRKRLAFNERHGFIKDVTVSGHFYILCHAVCKPHGVIGNARSNSHAGSGKPPMLKIAFNKLPGGGAQDMFARDGRASGQQGHQILQLIAETIGAAGLIEA